MHKKNFRKFLCLVFLFFCSSYVKIISPIYSIVVSGSGKFKVVEDYNKMKGFIDLSDQMTTYLTFL